MNLSVYHSSQNNGPASNEQRNVLSVANQRYQPLISENNTTRSIAGLFRDPLDKFHNLTKEIKAQIVPAAIEVKNNVLSVLGVNTNTSNNNALSNQQQGAETNNRPNSFVGQNAPAPPLADNRQQQQQVNHVESAQVAPLHNRLLNQGIHPSPLTDSS